VPYYQKLNLEYKQKALQGIMTEAKARAREQMLREINAGKL